jgi:hypothetical protein
MIRLPATIRIGNRVFDVVEKKHRRAIREGDYYGEGDSQNATITIHRWRGISDRDVLDTFWHECREMWLAENGCRTKTEGETPHYVFHMDHDRFAQSCALDVEIHLALAAANQANC